MRKLLLFLFPLFALLLGSCSKPEHYKVIPSNAPVVFMINSPGIIKKVTLNSIGNLNVTETWKLFQDTVAPTTKVGRLLKNTGDAGIDPKEEIYGWINYNGKNYWSTVCFYLADQNKLNQYVKDSIKSEITTVGQFQTAVLDSISVLAWNKTSALIVYGDSFMGLDSLKQTLTSLPDAEKGVDNITAQEGFKTMKDAGHDGSIWIRSELIKDKLPRSMAPFGYIDGYFYADFNNGQIEFSVEENVKDKDLQAYTGILNSKSSLDDFSSFNKDKLIGAVAGSVNLNSAFLTRYKDSLSIRLAQFNVTGDDVYKSFTGDFIIGAQGVKKTQRIAKSYDIDDDFNIIEKIDTVEDSKPLLTASLKLKDEKMAVIVLDKIAEKMGLMLTGGQYITTTMGETMHVYIKQGNLVITNDESVWTSKSAGTGLSSEAKTALQQPLSFYLNYQLMHKMDLGAYDPYRNTDATAREIASQLDFMSIGVQEEKPNVYKFKLNLYLLNKEENALIQFMKFRRNKQKSTTTDKANV